MFDFMVQVGVGATCDIYLLEGIVEVFARRMSHAVLGRN